MGQFNNINSLIKRPAGRVWLRPVGLDRRRALCSRAGAARVNKHLHKSRRGRRFHFCFLTKSLRPAASRPSAGRGRPGGRAAPWSRRPSMSHTSGASRNVSIEIIIIIIVISGRPYYCRRSPATAAGLLFCSPAARVAARARKFNLRQRPKEVQRGRNFCSA